MTFYIFDAKRIPLYPEETVVIESSQAGLANNKEISFNMSESFFQIPPSLQEDAEISEEESRHAQTTLDNSGAFYVPETQYTPQEDEQNILVNVTADRSILLPSITSVLEASARSAQNYRRQSFGPMGQLRKKAPISIDRLELPSQIPNSPLLYGSTRASESAMDLTEDSLLLALNSSIILCDEKPHEMAQGRIPMGNPKFSLDFLNTPPPHLQGNNFDELELGSSDEVERVPTQVLIQNLGGEDETQLNVNHEISLLSMEDGKFRTNLLMKFDPLDLVPNTPSALEEGHDAIYFPDSFDETNNPFLGTNPKDKKQANGLFEPINENSEPFRNNRVFVSDSKESVQPSSFQARLLSVSPVNLNLNDFGPRRIVLSARKTCATKPAPLSIKTSTTTASAHNSMSLAGSSESVPVPEPVKKSLGARMKRNPTASTPSKQPSLATVEEEKYLNHILKTGNKRISVIVAEPRKTPIAGIKTSSSQVSSFIGTPSKILKTPSRSNLVKEAHLASYYTDLILSSPCPPQKESNCSSPAVPPVISLDPASNLYFKENQWVFFKNVSSYPVGSIVSKTSKTRDTWRVKQSNGTEFTVSSLEMCPVAFLRPADEFNWKHRKTESQRSFKFKRFNPSNNLMIEVQDQQPEDQLKLTRISVEKESFSKIRDRFDHGCTEDSQIRDQIMMTYNSSDHSTMTSVATLNSKRKKRLINVTETQPSPTPSKRSRQQQIFLGMKFLITLGENKEDTALKEKYSRLIESHGGELLTNLSTDHEIPVLKTFLLSNGFKRTQKYMTAIIRGVPRVHFNWIEACCNQGCFIDPTSFSTFLLEPPLGCKPTGLLFKSKKFFFSGSSKFKNSWVGVIRLLGGTVSNAPSGSTIILTEDPKACVKGAVEKIVNVDWLINCITEKTFK